MSTFHPYVVGRLARPRPRPHKAEAFRKILSRVAGTVAPRMSKAVHVPEKPRGHLAGKIRTPIAFSGPQLPLGSGPPGGRLSVETPVATFPQNANSSRKL